MESIIGMLYYKEQNMPTKATTLPTPIMMTLTREPVEQRICRR